MAWTVLADASRAAKQKAASAAAAGIPVRMRGLVVFIYGNFSAAFLVIYYCDYTKADARMQAFSAFGQEGELTQDKCYRGGELDEASGNTLTQVRGYRNNEHESVRQTRVPRPHPRPLPARRSAAQAAHPRRVLRHLRLSSQKR